MKKRKSTQRCGVCPKPVLFPENLTIFDVFFSCFSQWRKDYLGNQFIDYQSVKVTAEFMDIDMTPRMFEKFRVMEREYIKINSGGENGS